MGSRSTHGRSTERPGRRSTRLGLVRQVGFSRHLPYDPPLGGKGMRDGVGASGERRTHGFCPRAVERNYGQAAEPLPGSRVPDDLRPAIQAAVLVEVEEVVALNRLLNGRCHATKALLRGHPST